MRITRRTWRTVRCAVGLSCAFLFVVLFLKVLTDAVSERNNDAQFLRAYDSDVGSPIDQNSEQKEIKQIDWHNEGQEEADKKREGPGEHGVAFHLPQNHDKTKKEMLYRQNGFNALASDYIALDRAVKDIRHPECKSLLYQSKLPSVSVILPFNNEHLSVILRTVTSIVNRSPKQVLKEVILADDFSDREHLRQPLEDYIQKLWAGLVKVVRASKREGLIRTRLMGARAATGEVLIFLDSHSECNYNWLPPLVEPIANDYRTVVCPFVDVIDYETFEYRTQDYGARGAFDWELYYKRLPLLSEDIQNLPKPFKSPVMAGGYFAISSKWFWELGGYDEGLDIWGGEQYELSFKIWQCGGQMVDAACSRVGHIYRKFAPFTNPGVGDYVGRNYKRVAEVWMDEFKEYIYLRRPRYRSLDAGDLSKQKALRERLNCKSFKWFMEEIAFDLTKKYPPIEPESGGVGEIRNVKANLCVDTRYKGQNERFELEPCIKDDPQNNNGEQKFELTWHRDIRPYKRNMCFDVSGHTDRSIMTLYSCHGLKGNQQWTYRLHSKQLYHPTSRLCLDCDVDTRELFMRKCDGYSETQKWEIDGLDRKIIERWQ